MATDTSTSQQSDADVATRTDSGSLHHQKALIEFTGSDGEPDQVSAAQPMPIDQSALDQRFKVYSDTNFVSGDSPVTHDVNTDLSRDGITMMLICDGTGDLTVAVSNDGASYSDEWPMRSGETLELSDLTIDKIRVTHVADSAYRILVN